MKPSKYTRRNRKREKELYIKLMNLADEYEDISMLFIQNLKLEKSDGQILDLTKMDDLYGIIRYNFLYIPSGTGVKVKLPNFNKSD